MVRITVPHYFDFGEDTDLVGEDLVRPEAWDALRTRTRGPFSMPESRLEWEAIADEHPALRLRAEAIDALLSANGAEALASYGVGGAPLECWLKRLAPARPLLIGEYAPATAERLQGVFAEAEVHLHNLLSDPPLPADWHLFHRIDSEFTNEQWRRIFGRFSDQSVLFVPGQLMPLRGLIGEVYVRLRGRARTRSGFSRNRAALRGLWRRTHDAEPVQIGDLSGWVLTPRS
jgi:hypothetical protein